MFERILEIWRFPIYGAGGDSPITVGTFILALVVAVGGYIASRLIARYIRSRLARTSLKPDVAHALQRISFYTLLIVVGMTVLSLLHIPLTAFAFVSGAIAIGVSFGAQNIISATLSK
jgi:small-conductance mechanosensitive channel